MAREVTDVVLNISGTIAFSDKSQAPIETTLAYHHNISNPYTNLVNFATLSRDKSDILADFFGVLYPSIVALAPDATPAIKTVTDLILEMTGDVAYNDRTHASFSVRYVNGILSYPDDVADLWADMVEGDAALLTSLFEKIAGTGNVALAEYLFTYCSDCSGEISAVSPGPVCGWIFDDAFGPGDSYVTLESGGVLIMSAESETDYMIARKELPEPVGSTFDKSGRWTFSEYQTIPNGTTTYQYWVNNSDISEIITISLFGDGNLIFQFGPVDLAYSWIGTWTPDGGTHTVHFSTGSLTEDPKLYINGVEVPLIFLGQLVTFGAQLVPNMIAVMGGSGETGSSTSVVSNIVLTTGTIGPNVPLGC